MPLVWLFVLVVPPAPLSTATAASSQKLADMPPPRSSMPRKPRRDVELPPEPSWVRSATLPEPRWNVESTMPNRVTDDWAAARLDAATSTEEITSFFIDSSDGSPGADHPLRDPHRGSHPLFEANDENQLSSSLFG